MKFNEDYVPSTFDEAVDYILEGLTEEDKKYIINNSPNSIHFTMGMAIRNNFGLWERGTLLFNDMNRRFNLCHGDDFSSLILEGVWARVKNLNVEECLNKKVESFKKHWLDCGINPKNGEKLK